MLVQRTDDRRDVTQIVAELVIAPGQSMDVRLRDHAGVQIDMGGRDLVVR